MAETTLADVVKRLTTLEMKIDELIAAQPVKFPIAEAGTMEDNEFTRAMLAAIEENSEAERRAALEEAE